MWEDADDAQQVAMAFGPYRLLLAQKLLLKNDAPVRLGARAMDILTALVERPGELLSRKELESRAWPSTVVEETSLRVHMSALRRALEDGKAGARYITNVPGRGYCFVAPLDRQDAVATPAPKPAVVDQGPAAAHPLSSFVPSRLTSMVGRGDAVARLVDLVPQRRLVTVLGPGGIGKTTVALAVAERLRSSPSFADTTCFVDLSLLSDPSRVPALLAAAFGLADFPDDPLGAVARLLGSRPVLLVLDGCEHVIDAVAHLSTILLAGAPGLRLLATSRELIGVDGECLVRLPALALPAQRPTAVEALASSAVQLFVERARANADSFLLSDDNAPLVAELCRRLGGIPLAIEVAAARLEQFGLRGLVDQVDAGFLHMRRGRRTGVSRHEALSAMLDWSHRLLSDAEQTILRRISVFRSPFTLRSAIWVASDADLSDSEVINGLAGLRAKSLLNRVVLGEIVKHQMLDHTRAYAMQKLSESVDEDAVRRRHALLVSDLLGQAERNWPLMAKREWMATHGSLLLAIHTALTWAFSPKGDPLIGAALTSVSWPMARFLFLEDFEVSIRRAIEALDRMPDPPRLVLIRLHLGMATHLQERRGNAVETRAAFERATELARGSGDFICEIETEMGEVRDAMGDGDSPRAVAIVERVQALARAAADPVASVVAMRLGAVALHLHGDQRRARELALAVRNHKLQRGPLASAAGIVDHRVAMDIVLARILWLEGLPDQAAQLARQSLELAEVDSTLAVSQALALAVCPIAIWRGDDDAAQLACSRLLAEATRLGTSQFLSLAQGCVEILGARGPGRHGPAYRRPLNELATAGFPFVQDQLSTLDRSHWHEASLMRANEGREGWCAPEIWRRHALRLWAGGAPREAEALLERSLALAGSQGALAWSLRAATSLARLRLRQGRVAEALGPLADIHGRFTEGAGTRDLTKAAHLLAELRALASRQTQVCQ